jgi:hypothetical protein
MTAKGEILGSVMIRAMTDHIGHVEVKGAVLQPLFRIQGLSRFHDLMVCCTRSSSHTVAACFGCTNIPRSAGGAQEAPAVYTHVGRVPGERLQAERTRGEGHDRRSREPR